MAKNLNGPLSQTFKNGTSKDEELCFAESDIYPRYQNIRNMLTDYFPVDLARIVWKAITLKPKVVYNIKILALASDGVLSLIDNDDNKSNIIQQYQHVHDIFATSMIKNDGIFSVLFNTGSLFELGVNGVLKRDDTAPSNILNAQMGVSGVWYITIGGRFQIGNKLDHKLKNVVAAVLVCDQIFFLFTDGVVQCAEGEKIPISGNGFTNIATNVSKFLLNHPRFLLTVDNKLIDLYQRLGETGIQENNDNDNDITYEPSLIDIFVRYKGILKLYNTGKITLSYNNVLNYTLIGLPYIIAVATDDGFTTIAAITLDGRVLVGDVYDTDHELHTIPRLRLF